MRLLICEDEVLIALALEDLVVDLGYDVVARVRTSSQARKIAEAETPDIALVDLGLADGWTGPDLIEEFHAAGIRCIAISGQIEELEGGSNAFGMLPKPVDEGKLAQLLSELSESDRIAS